MKRVILSSFGWDDDKWLNPPEDFLVGHDEEAQIKISNFLVDYEDGGVDILKGELPIRIEDWETEIEIIDSQDLEEIIYETLGEVLYDRVASKGRYIIDGIIYVPYTAYYPDNFNTTNIDGEDSLEEFFECEIYRSKISFEGTCDFVD